MRKTEGEAEFCLPSFRPFTLSCYRDYEWETPPLSNKAVSVARRMWRRLDRLAKGLYSPLETIERILELALEPEFYQDIDHLPPEIIDELRQIAETAPAHPEDSSGVFGGLLFHHDEARDIEARERYDLGMRRLHYWAARRLREHFFPNWPEPKFEPVKCIGQVSETEMIEEGVVAFGDFAGMLIRRHPVFIMTPSGDKVSTSHTSCSVDRARRKMNATGEFRGENGLLLGRNVRSPIDVPPESTLWVDRSSIDPNPPPPPFPFPNDPPWPRVP